MKYVITENRLENFFKNYLNSFLETKVISNLDNFILISQRAGNDDYLWEDFMEFDYSDGRLWVNRDVLKSMNDIFNFDKETLTTLIKEWFEDRFKVYVKYVES